MSGWNTRLRDDFGDWAKSVSPANVRFAILGFECAWYEWFMLGGREIGVCVSPEDVPAMQDVGWIVGESAFMAWDEVSVYCGSGHVEMYRPIPGELLHWQCEPVRDLQDAYDKKREGSDGVV